MRIDTRAGSSDLIAPLTKAGVPVEPAILPAGDVEIMGRGPDGRIVPVLVEYKKLPDVLQCMRDGRFAEQLRGMQESAEINWLLIEGRLRKHKWKDILEVQHGSRWRSDGKYRMQEFQSWLQTMVMRGGVLLWRTETFAETCAWLRSLHIWWTAREFESHRAHHDYYRPETLGGVSPFEPPSLVQKVAAVLPGIGVTRAAEVAKKFKTVAEMACAAEEDWLTIKGIGKKGAKNLVGAIK